MSNITTSQTIGPFSHEAWQWAADVSAAVGGAITIRGVIYDGDGAPINDAQLECWQPAAVEAEAEHPLPGFRRIPSGEQGEFALRLADVQPAAGQPFVYITVFARGLVKHQFTVVFLEDDASLPAAAILEQVPAARRATVIASRAAPGEYRWDIRMQGAQETAFFDYV
jgi:protocatechuate 3,4-dioxygenase alpha subunit